MALSISNTELVDLGSLPINDYPFTLAGWFRVPVASNTITMIRVKNTVSNSSHIIFGENGVAVYAMSFGLTGAAPYASSSAPMTSGQWHHVTGVFEADSVRRVYLDGGNMGSSSDTRAFDGADLYDLGNYFSSDAVDAAEIGIFAGILDQAEIAMLANGFSMLNLPSAPLLLSYHDCVRSINRPGLGPVASSAGTPAIVDQPRVLMSSGGLSQVQPFRIRGPLQIDQDSYRTSFSEQAQHFVAGVDSLNVDNAGQLSVAGIASDSTVLYGEVLS